MRINIFIPDDLASQLKKHKTKINASKICQAALKEVCDSIDSEQKEAERYLGF